MLTPTIFSKELLEPMFNTGRMLRIVVARNTFGVVLPRGTPALDHPFVTLEIGLNLPVPVEVAFRRIALSATLSFSRTPVHCVVPYTALRAVYYADDNSGYCLAGPLEGVPPQDEVTRVVRRPFTPRLIQGGKA